MKTKAQIKAQEKWEAKKRKEGFIRWHVLTSPDIVEKLKVYYQTLKKG